MPIRNQHKLLMLLAGIALSACTTTAADLTVQSKFAYPNGDYTYLGHIQAEKKYMTTSFTAPEMTRDVFLDLQKQALAQQSGADMVVNYAISSSITTVPPIPVTWTTFRLDGTAIKVLNVGKQDYNNGPIPSPTRVQ
jgi:hypothetical protein